MDAGGTGRDDGRWSLWSEDSFLSIASKNSALSIGSVNSVLSIGSIGSAGSILSIGCAGCIGSALSSLSHWSLMSFRSDRAISAAHTAGTTPAPLWVAAVGAGAVVAHLLSRRAPGRG